MSQFSCSTSFEDAQYTGSITQIHSIPMCQVRVRPLLKTLNTQGPSSKFTQFLCLKFRVLPLLETFNTQFLCLQFGVLPLLKKIGHTGSIFQIHSIPMSQVWCSTSFQDIEHTKYIIQILSIPMSQVSCSISFEDIEDTGSTIQIHSIPMSQVSCATSFERH